MGGHLGLEGSCLQLRLFLDVSSLEIFTCTGQVLNTRVYRYMAGMCLGVLAAMSLGYERGLICRNLVIFT